MNRSLLSLALLTLIAAALAHPGCSSGHPDDESAGPEAETREQVFAMHETVPLEDAFALVVDVVKTQPTTGRSIEGLDVYLSRAPAGSQYVIVEYDVTNNGASEEYNLVAAELRGPDGQSIPVDGSASANYSTHEMPQPEGAEDVDFNALSTYAPGETKRKASAFLVETPAWEAGGWTLVVEGDRVVTLN